MSHLLCAAPFLLVGGMYLYIKWQGEDPEFTQRFLQREPEPPVQKPLSERKIKRVLDEFSTHSTRHKRLQATLRRTLALENPAAVRKGLSPLLEQWLIEKKKPTEVGPHRWQKLVKDSFTDSTDLEIEEHGIPNGKRLVIIAKSYLKEKLAAH